MTDQHQTSTGTVAEEAARLIAAVATMARSSAGRGDDPTGDFSPYAAGPAQEPVPPDNEDASRPEDTARPEGEARPEDAPPAHASSAGAPSAGASEAPTCSVCGGDSDGTPVACKLCPLCQGIALLRSVRPETVDRLADLASALAAGLRDMAAQSRASGPAADAGSSSGRSSDRATVQDILVNDEDEG